MEISKNRPHGVPGTKGGSHGTNSSDRAGPSGGTGIQSDMVAGAADRGPASQPYGARTQGQSDGAKGGGGGLLDKLKSLLGKLFGGG